MSDILSPLDPRHWLDRLEAKTESFESFGLLKDAARGLDPSSGGIDRESVFVVYRSDAASTAQRNASQRTIQRITATLSIIIAIPNINDPRGERAAEDFRPLRADVMQALLGWTPPDAGFSCRYVRGALQRSPLESVAIWDDQYSADYRVTKDHE